LRERLGSRIEVEKVFLVLILVPVISNAIHLLFML